MVVEEDEIIGDPFADYEPTPNENKSLVPLSGKSKKKIFDLMGVSTQDIRPAHSLHPLHEIILPDLISSHRKKIVLKSMFDEVDAAQIYSKKTPMKIDTDESPRIEISLSEKTMLVYAPSSAVYEWGSKSKKDSIKMEAGYYKLILLFAENPGKSYTAKEILSKTPLGKTTRNYSKGIDPDKIVTNAIDYIHKQLGITANKPGDKIIVKKNDEYSMPYKILFT